MSNATQGTVASEAATRRQAGNPPPNRPSGDADGMSASDEALLADALGLNESSTSAASADEGEGDPSQNDLSQTESEGSPETEEAAAEASDEAAEDSGEEGEGEGEGAAPEKPKAIQGMQKRIDKLTARLKQQEAELTELRTGQPAAPGSFDPVESDAEIQTSVQALAKVTKDIEAVRELKARLRSDPRFVENLLKQHLKPLPDYEADTMREALDEMAVGLRETAAQHRAKAEGRREIVKTEVARKREAVMGITTAEMPWVNDDEDPRYEEYARAMKDPFIASRPDAAFFVAAGIEKLTAIRARQQQQAAKPAAAKPAVAKVRPPGGGVGAPPQSKTPNARQGAGQRFLENPSEDGLLEALEAEFAETPAPRSVKR